MKTCPYVKNGIKYRISGKNLKILGKNKKISEKIRKFWKNSDISEKYPKKKNANFF